MRNAVLVRTEVTPNQIRQWIEYDTEFSRSQGTRLQRHAEEVLDLRESGIRDALIKLGWTPPEEDNGH